MSDWFKNSPSEIPDELWRAPAPMQRQVDAAVLWAELTGKHASFDGVKAFGQTLALNPRSDELEKAFKHYEKKTGKRRDQMSQRDIYNSLLATGMGKKASAEKTARNETAVRLLHAINDNRVAAGAIAGTPVGMGKAYLDYRPQESGISNAEAKIVGRLAELKARGGASKSEIDSLKKDMERAKDRRENLARTVAFGGATGGAMGAGLGALSKYRRAAAKARK